MKYTKFEVKNFKGIKNLTLNLSSEPKLRIATLVGINESGKTTVLEALNLFQNDIPDEKRYTLIPKGKVSNFNDSIMISAELVLEDKDEEKIKKYCESIGFIDLVKINNIKIKKEYFFKNSKYISDSKTWDVKLVGKKKRSTKVNNLLEGDTMRNSILDFIKSEMLPSIIYYPNFLFDFPSRIYLEKYEGEPKGQEFYRNVIQDILDSLNEGLNINDHIITRLKSNTDAEKEALDSTLLKMSTKVTSTVFKAWSTLFQAKGKQISIRTDKEPLTDQTPEKYYIEMRLKDGGDQYQISERSLGFKWFFAFLLFTEFRKNRASEKGEILFLLDEPASNLHSTAQSKLKKTFKSLVNKSRLIYTTHSHHLIEPEWLENAFVVINKALDYSKEFDFDSSKTNIMLTAYKEFVSASPNKQTYFQPILDALEYRPSDLEMVPQITIVEGKFDFYTLSYFHNVIFKRRIKKINLYPGNGAGKNDQVMRLYLSWVRKFNVLMDADEAGVKAKQKYMDEFGKQIDGKVFTLEDIDKKWIGFELEDLFSMSEKLEVIKILNPKVKSYSKEKFNLGIQHILFEKITVKLSVNTRNSFKAILTTLSKSY